jgi:hypothetical protein
MNDEDDRHNGDEHEDETAHAADDDADLQQSAVEYVLGGRGHIAILLRPRSVRVEKGRATAERASSNRGPKQRVQGQVADHCLRRISVTSTIAVALQNEQMA